MPFIAQLPNESFVCKHYCFSSYVWCNSKRTWYFFRNFRLTNLFAGTIPFQFHEVDSYMVSFRRLDWKKGFAEFGKRLVQLT